jgi:glycosyltransferase involved in cell wall biosynthesis
MSTRNEPLVSVVTPVYNGADFLEECIESVLKQTYGNFEYLIVNNCSKDRTLDIALSYAQKDSRIRVHDNTEFLAVIANHNHAFGLISPAAKYCKVVSGDDAIFPECLTKLVELAEANPSVGMVGCYQQSGRRVRWQGFKYPDPVLPGRQMCREIFLSDDPDLGFGSPTSLLYRADLLRSNKEYYPDPSPHSDTSACFRDLLEHDFGFVYEILSYERVHEQTQSYRSSQMNRYSSAWLHDLLRFGPACLSAEEFKRRRKETVDGYYRFLAVNYFGRFAGDDFWNYHRGRLEELGYPFKRTSLYKAGLILALQGILNPELTIRKFWNRKFSGRERNIVPAVQAKTGSEGASRDPAV